jgi:hypothetical protein
MNHFRLKPNLLFSLIIAGAVILKPVWVFAGIGDLVHPSLVIPKIMSSTMGTPARSLGAYSRLDKMEKDALTGVFLKAQPPKARLGLGFLELKGLLIQIPGPIGFSILRI